MSNQSNDHGRAYEYVCLTVLYDKINKYRKCVIEENSSFIAAQNAWNNIDEMLQGNLALSAESFVGTLFELEPLIIEDSGDILKLNLQADFKGEEGDVRDIIILRSDINWEIGLSIKHNHFAVKHSRLAKTLDFGQKWFGRKCTSEYWDIVYSTFDYLEFMKKHNKEWKELPSKEDDVYVPLLKAFMDEINRQNKMDSNTPKKMVEYLLGEFDFYKVISMDARKTTQIQAFNLHGTLNQSSKSIKPSIEIPITNLPTRIVSLDFKPNSKNTVELYLDNGWQFSFRIHNASTLVETSLKFDIQIIGMPTTVISINCRWK